MKYEIPTIPKLKYADESTSTLSLRLPDKLIERLREEAESKNLAVTGLCKFVLDQYLQEADKSKGRRKK